MPSRFKMPSLDEGAHERRLAIYELELAKSKYAFRDPGDRRH